MASMQSIGSGPATPAANFNGHTNLAQPGPQSRPNQPPPPPPLPSVPPVPPTRDSSIAITRATINNKRTPIPAPPPPSSSTTTIGANDQHHHQQQQHHHAPQSATLSSSSSSSSSNTTTVTKTASFLGRFEPLFRPIGELPAPEPFMNKPKSYPSQRVQSAAKQQPAATATSHS